MFRNEKGQASFEYALILLLVAIVLTVLAALLGPALVDVISGKNQQPVANTQVATYCDESTCLTVETRLGSDDSTEHCTVPLELVYKDTVYQLRSCILVAR